MDIDDPLVYLNGEFTPLSQARVPVLDRGFIFGDGVYDVVPLYGRRMFRPAQHLARLARSLRETGIPNPHDDATWLDLIGRVSAALAATDQLVYIQVTRGVARRGHAFPANVTPTVFIMANPLVPPSQEMRQQGVACVSIEDQRWLRCDIKATSLLGNVLAAQHAASHGVTEAVQFRDGWLTEGSSTNIWVVAGGVLMTPPRDNLILEGIRYGLLEELCGAIGITFQSRRIAREDVTGADELLMSSASKEVLAITTLDGQRIGNGAPGPIYHALYQAYQEAKRAP